MELVQFLNQYQKGERDFSHVDLAGANLSGMSFRDINLTGANLTAANLSWTTLSNAILTGACLHQADLRSVNLNRANLDQAILSRAKLHKADLRLATLQGSDLNWADLQEADLSGAELRGSKLEQVNLEQTKLNGVNLSNCDLMEANLRRSSLINAKLRESNLRESNLEEANLRDADLEGASLTEANLHGVYMRGCNLKDVDLHRAILTGADLSDVILDSADLSRANLTGTYLLKASLRRTILLRTVLQSVYLLRADLTEANLRGADLREADLSGAYICDASLSEANLAGAYLLETRIIRTKFEQTQMTGCCIHNWYLEDVDLSKAECNYVFTRFNYGTKNPTDRFPPDRHFLPGELGKSTSEDSTIIEVSFTIAPLWEALALTITQVELECTDVQLQVKSYETRELDYLLRLQGSRLVNSKILAQRILKLYPEVTQKLQEQRTAIYDLMDIKVNGNVATLVVEPTSPVAQEPAKINPQQLQKDDRQRIYQEVVNQIQHIIMFQNPARFVESVQRLLMFLQDKGISTEEVQKTIIGRILVKRSHQDPEFQNQLMEWEKNVDESARFSLVGESIRLALATLWAQEKS
jgi:uncharacterized protein YjbI with pentapeptide repeats